MNRQDYQKVMDRIEPSSTLRDKTLQKLENKNRKGMVKFPYQRYAIVAVLLISMISLPFLLSNNEQYKKMEISKSMDRKEKSGSAGFDGYVPDQNKTMQDEVVTEEEIGISNNQGSQKGSDSFNAAGFVEEKIESNGLSSILDDQVKTFLYYNGKYYFSRAEAKIKLSENVGEANKGEFLGLTVENNSNQNRDEQIYGIAEVASLENFSSSIPNHSVYTVNGYNPSYRLMVVDETQKSYQLVESWDGLLIQKGADYFEHLYLKGNIQSATWETPKSFYSQTSLAYPFENMDRLNKFIELLYNAKPVVSEKEMGFIDEQNKNQKILILKMKNKVKEILVLSKNTKTISSTSGFYFKIDEKEFDSFYDLLK